MDASHQLYAAFGDDPVESVEFTTETLDTKIELDPGLYHFVADEDCVFRRGEDADDCEIEDVTVNGQVLPGGYAYFMDIEVKEGANFFDIVGLAAAGRCRIYRSTK